MAEEFFKLMTHSEAVRDLVEALPEREIPEGEVETGSSLGRVLSRDILAPEDLPGFDRSSMDGYAVRASDTFGASEGLPAYLKLAGEVPMGGPGDLSFEPGQAVRISTGGALPRDADAVLMVENTEISGDTVEVVRPVAPGDNVILRDEDIPEGSLLLERGRVLGPAQVGALTALGINRVSVFVPPTIGIISTGDELIEPDKDPRPGQIRDINTASLKCAVAQSGCSPRCYGIVADELGALLDVTRRALSECDALIISGGSSVGTRDNTLEVIEHLGTPGVLAHGLHIKPGKPTLVAVCDGKPVLGLPGNPASALVVFREVVAPVLAHLRGESAGVTAGATREVEAVMDRSIASAPGRLELVPVALSREGKVLMASPIMGKSSLIGTLSRATGQVRIPRDSEGLERGQRVKVEILG